MLSSNSAPPSSCSLLFTLLTGLAYPLALTGVASVAFPGPGRRQPDRDATARWSARR